MDGPDPAGPDDDPAGEHRRLRPGWEPPAGVPRLAQGYPEFEADPYGFLPIDRDGQLLPRQGEPVTPTPRLPEPAAGQPRFPRPQAVSGRLPLPLLRLARHPCSESGAFPAAGPAVRLAFHTGSRKSPALHRQAREFARQLARQQDGLNAMTAEQYLQGRALYRHHGRGDRKPQKEARKKYEESLARANEKRGMSASEARRLARSSMEALAALHEPDGIAGGQNRIGRDPFGNPSLGTSGVNSSIGRQHQDHVHLLDQAAVHMLRTGQGHALLNVEVVLCEEPERTDEYRLDLDAHRVRARPVELSREELAAQAQAAHIRRLWEREIPAVPGQTLHDPQTGTPSLRIPDAYRDPITGSLGPPTRPDTEPPPSPWSRPPHTQPPAPGVTAADPTAGTGTARPSHWSTPAPSEPAAPGPARASRAATPSTAPDPSKRAEQTDRTGRVERPERTDRERRQAARQAHIRHALAQQGMTPTEIEDTLAGLLAAELGHPEPPAEAIRRAREQHHRQGQTPGPWTRPSRPRRPGPDRGIER